MLKRKMRKSVSAHALDAALKSVFGYVPQIEEDTFGQIIIYTDYMTDPANPDRMVPFLSPED
jgi:hypothetical protein